MENRLREIIVSVTNRCNLRCAMCQIPEMADGEEVSTEILKDLINDAVKLNPNSIVFSGGEPLLRKDIFELISLTNNHKINTCLTSNGILLDDSVAGKLASSGIGVVNISIEGPERVHDSLRGRGNFKKALRALENLARHKIETTIATIVCRQNYRTLPFVMDLAHQFKVTTVKFQPFSDIFLKRKNIKNKFFLSPKVLKDLERSISQVIDKSKEYKISTNPCNYLYTIPAYLSGAWKNDSNNACSALRSSCPISANGNVYLCWVLSEKPIGNIKKTKLYNIWNSPEHNLAREAVEKCGCLGCLMSCYDNNRGKDDLPRVISLKSGKFKKPGFYKRQYYRLYQSMRYLSGKIINRLINSTRRPKNNDSEISAALDEIRTARNILKRKKQRLGR